MTKEEFKVYNDTIKHYLNKIEEALFEKDLSKAYCYSHGLDDLSGDLAFDLYHEYMREAERDNYE